MTFETIKNIDLIQIDEAFPNKMLICFDPNIEISYKEWNKDGR